MQTNANQFENDYAADFHHENHAVSETFLTLLTVLATGYHFVQKSKNIVAAYSFENGLAGVTNVISVSASVRYQVPKLILKLVLTIHHSRTGRRYITVTARLHTAAPGKSSCSTQQGSSAQGKYACPYNSTDAREILSRISNHFLSARHKLLRKAGS
jgi:hypothetical protein